jgi:predicted molibdopterin-dependent oxidoreductase YjgC
VLRAKLHGCKLVVIGTRRHRLAESADIFLQIRPGTEPLLYGAMAKIIVDRGLMDLAFIKSRCCDYEGFAVTARQYDLLNTADAAGVSPELIESAALTLARAKSAAILYSTGIESRTQEHIRAIVDLVLLTGNLGKPGAGIFALSEQNNLQGVCEMGMLPDRLPGYGSVGDPAARVVVEQKWSCKIPQNPGLSARALLEGEDHIKALWFCRYDPVSTAALAEAASSIRQCEFVVVQHLFMTETARYADVVLPTTAFGEEQVSFTNTERRIQLAQKVVEPPEGLTPAWQQITRVARLLGTEWNYQSAAEVMDEIGAVVPFYSGANYKNLAREYGRQWPCTTENPLGTPLMFAHRNGEPPFKFVPLPKPASELAQSQEYPFTLVFGHSLYYWNQNVLVRHSEILQREYRVLLLDYPEGFVEIGTDDAKKLGIRDGEKIRLRAATASVVSTARVTPEVRSGTIFVPYFVREVEEQILSAGVEGKVQVRVEKEAT